MNSESNPATEKTDAPLPESLVNQDDSSQSVSGRTPAETMSLDVEPLEQEIDALKILREGTHEVCFCGEPIAFSPIVLTLLQAKCFGLTPELPHGPVCPTLATTAPRLDTQALEAFAREQVQHPMGGFPVLFNAAPLAPDERLTTLIEGARAHAPHSRAERSFHWTSELAAWLAHRRATPSVHLRGMLALELFCIEELWREISVQMKSGRRRLFRSAADFVSTTLALWGKPLDATRICHERRAARFCLRMRERGLPLPNRLSHVEKLSLRDDGLDLYAELVSRNLGSVPSPTQIAQALKHGILGMEAIALARTHRSSRKKELEQVTKNLLQHCTRYADPALQAMLQKLQKLTLDEAKVEMPKPVRMPRYPADLPSPITVVQDLRLLTLTVESLPHPMPYRAKSRLPKGWLLRELEAERFQVALELSANPAQAISEREQAYAWALDICDEIGAKHPDFPAPPLAACM